MKKYDYAQIMYTAKFSAIRSIASRATKNGTVAEAISFSGGFPDPQALPQDAFLAMTAKVFKDNTFDILKYGEAQGYIGLRESAKDFLNTTEVICKEEDDIVITPGSQQGLYLASKIFINDGDALVMEEPSYLGAINCFRGNGAKLLGIPLEEDGVNIDALESVFSSSPKPKLFYTIPNFQNPTGITTSLEKRKAIYALARKYGVIILEDNPYGYLRTSGEDIPSIKSLDTDGLVIYAGSLSKILVPGIRTGLLVANREIIEKIILAKQVNDSHTNSLAQYTMDGLLRSLDMEEHIQQLRTMYSKKRSFMLEMMDTYFHPAITYHKPEGGMFVWFTLPASIPMLDFVEKTHLHCAW